MARPPITGKSERLFREQLNAALDYVEGLGGGGGGGPSAWSRAGNSGTSSESDFIGTTDNVPMVFKSNNLRRLVIGANGNIGINLSTNMPGQLLHLGDGNILLEGGGETAMLFKLGTTLDGVTPLGATHPNAPFVNPIFQIGRVIEGGDGAPQFRWMYSDDNKGERVVFELDSEGILSSVRQTGVRGSHFEAHRSGDTHPLFRLNSFPHMQLQMGNGGTDDTDIAIGRTSAQKGALQYGPPTAQVTAAEWSSAGFKVAVGGLIFPDNSVQTTALATGPKGDKGDKGDTGDTGATGATGPAGTNGVGVPTGGSAGQVLSKINSTDYNTQWVTPSAGGGVNGSSIVTVPNNRREWSETISTVGVTPSSIVVCSLAPHPDADENSEEMLDVVSIVGIPGTDQTTFSLTFSTPVRGNIRINWRA